MVMVSVKTLRADEIRHSLFLKRLAVYELSSV